MAGRTGGVALEDDITRWTYWWEFNKNAFLGADTGRDGAPQTGSDDFYLGATRIARSANDTVAPTTQQAVEVILPALKAAIDATDNRDIATAAMIAMAKIGRNHPEFELVDVFAERLPRGDQEVRETAALAIGIAAIDGERELDLLLGLAADDRLGRSACRSAAVPTRTRAFAAYGAGLLAHRSERMSTRFRVTKALARLVDDERCERNLLVGAIHGLGLLRFASTTGEQALLGGALDSLERCFLARSGAGDELLRSHCPTAIARLIDPFHPRAEHLRELFTLTLTGKERPPRQGHDLARSCALALGRLCRPDGADRSRCEALLETYRGHRDQQTRWFSILALGLIGGRDNRDVLLRELGHASDAQEKPWCALALGVLEHAQRQVRRQQGQMPERDALVGQALHDEFLASRNPDLTGALAVALGLCRHEEALEDMRARLHDSRNQAELAGHLCIGIGLIGDRRAAEPLRQVMRTSVRNTDLMRQAALALGHLGDRNAALDLHAMLTDADSNLARLAAIATALGHVGDQRSIEPLLQALANGSLTQLSRAFAAAALGGIADKEAAPWNSKIAIGINYRATVETLIDQSAGILDIL